MVVPFPAGGNADLIAREIAQALTEKLGKTVIIENKAGAAGNIGGAYVAKSKPDGYTLLFSTPSPLALNKLMYKSLSFDPEQDFSTIILVA
jgi:tripartite-type tricarboxylate transporter receptor subunit TctC